MDNPAFGKVVLLEKAIRYVKQYSSDIVLLLVVNMKTSTDYLNQYDAATEFFSQDELSDYLNALDMLSIYHDISYGEDDFIRKIGNNYFEKYKQQYKIVFNTTGSKHIRSRSALIPAVCEIAGLSYASNDILTCSILENKIHANSLLTHYGFPVPPSWYFYPDSGWLDYCPPQDRKLIIKPSEESASIGITQESVGFFSNEFESIVREVCDIMQEPVMVQEFIDGWEVEVPVVHVDERIALPPMGIEMDKDKYLNDRYLSFDTVFSDNYNYYRFDQIDSKLAEALSNVAENSSRVLDLRGTIRVDFRVNNKGQYFITDYNNSPHLTRFHSVAKSLSSIGFEYPDLFCLILYNSLNSLCQKSVLAKGHLSDPTRKTGKN